jgi:hypothetical protein
MTTGTGVTAVGTTVETIGVETTGVESKTAGKPNAVVSGSAIMIGPCSTATRATTATIVASAQPRD